MVPGASCGMPTTVSGTPSAWLPARTYRGACSCGRSRRPFHSACSCSAWGCCSSARRAWSGSPRPRAGRSGCSSRRSSSPPRCSPGQWRFSRDAIAAPVLSFYAVSWLALGLTQLSFAPQPTDTLGIYLIGFAIAVFAFAVVATVGKPLLAAVLTVSAVRALLQGLYEISGSTGVQHAGGVAGLVLAALAFYAGMAFLFEDALRKRVLPTFRRGAAAGALEGDLSDQL